MQFCANCGEEVIIEGKVSRNQTCPHCNAYLHCCLNCKFYRPGSHNDCREPQADYVRDKKSSNFCEYFVFNEKSPEDLKKIENKKKKARDAFDKLFGG